MSRTLTEKKVLNKLGIDNFREITKDKVIEMVSLYDKIDPEVVKEAIKQFPEFSKTMVEVLKEYKSSLDETLKENSKSTKEVYDAFNRISTECHTILEKDSLTFEEKMQILHLMTEVSRLISEKDSENKKFIVCVGALGLGAAVIAVNATLSVLGVNTRISLKS